MIDAQLTYIRTEDGVIAIIATKDQAGRWVKYYRDRESAVDEGLRHNLITERAATELRAYPEPDSAGVDLGAPKYLPYYGWTQCQRTSTFDC